MSQLPYEKEGLVLPTDGFYSRACVGELKRAPWTHNMVIHKEFSVDLRYEYL